jgi:hypothetical protein
MGALCALHSTCWCKTNLKCIPSFTDCSIKFSS